jgi:xanthine dehydrogenase accessory factor
MLDSPRVLIKGGGDLASGVAHRLHQTGFDILVTELAQPLVVRRTVAFATAVLQSEVIVEGVRARLIASASDAPTVWARGEIAVLVDPQAAAATILQPLCVVDAIVAKTNTGTRLTDAPIVVALGPGFTAGVDAHAVVETNRGHNLGRVYYKGRAEADSTQPSPLRGITVGRVLRAPVAGTFAGTTQIGAPVAPGDVVGFVGAVPVRAAVAGVIRGLIADGTLVTSGLKIGDIDPGGLAGHCFTISDKSRAIGGGVLEAIVHLQPDARGPG